MKRITVYSLLVLSIVSSVWADRLMDPNETETVLRHLTNTPRKSWISQGMIQARHLEYYEYDNSMKDATETIYCNDSRYRLEIRLEDGLPTDDTADQSMIQQLRQDLALNRDRIFVWDGHKDIKYYQSADYAAVTADPLNSPRDLCGPATAGIIPWGHGDFTFLVLMSQNPECYETRQDGQDRVMLKYLNEVISSDTVTTFLLDPAKDYAVTSYSLENAQALLRQTYQDYLQVGDCWIPSKVLIERFDKRSGTPQLISYEDWQFEAIDPTAPAEDVFSVHFKNGTMVELKAAGSLQTFMYNASDQVDITTILEDKIALLQADNPDSVNCATAVIQHVAKRFSKTILPTELAGLVSQDTKKTALSAMKQTFDDAGLNCMAVEADLNTLETIPDCTKILYLSFSKHYVILDHIDDDGIWIIDLTNRKFYAKRDIDEFMQEWTTGVTLLVSNQPINPPLDANFRYLEPDEMAAIYGGAGFGTYSCTDLIHGNSQILCPGKVGGLICYGVCYIFYERYGCIEDETGSTCIGEPMPSYDYYHCQNDPTTPSGCGFNQEKPITRFIRACK